MSDYVQVLESFPGTAKGKSDAWSATERHAKTLRENKVTDRFAIGVRQIHDETTRGTLWAVVLVARKD